MVAPAAGELVRTYIICERNWYVVIAILIRPRDICVRPKAATLFLGVHLLLFSCAPFKGRTVVVVARRPHDGVLSRCVLFTPLALALIHHDA